MPLADEQLLLEYPFERLRNEVLSGGPPKDGIPSVDGPTFTGVAEDQRLDPHDIVFGVAKSDDVKAYPQYVLVQHEIVNDTLGGTPVSVTYCPLTGTAMGDTRRYAEENVTSLGQRVGRELCGRGNNLPYSGRLNEYGY